MKLVTIDIPQTILVLSVFVVSKCLVEDTRVAFMLFHHVIFLCRNKDHRLRFLLLLLRLFESDLDSCECDSVPCDCDLGCCNSGWTDSITSPSDKWTDSGVSDLAVVFLAFFFVSGMAACTKMWTADVAYAVDTGDLDWRSNGDKLTLSTEISAFILLALPRDQT